MRLKDMHEALEATVRSAAAALQNGDIEFMLGGSMASWARGGPLSRKDVDIYVRAEDAQRARDLLEACGMKPQDAPERWLLKVWNDDVLIDLIFDPLEGPVTSERIAAAEWMPVLGIWMHVLPLEDVLVGRLLALSEQRLEFGGLIEIARALRERIDWAEVHRRTDGSPCAAAFFALIRGLGIIEDASIHGRPSIASRLLGRGGDAPSE